jgi:hypothetical protein
MKRVLIIGDGNSVFVLNHVKNIVLSDNSITFDIFLTNSFLRDEYREYFNNIYYSHKKSFFTQIPVFKGAIIRLLIIVSLLRFRKKYEITHIQFLNDNIIYFNIFRNFSSKVVLSIWGSDFYRSKGINLWLKKLILKDADIITFANEQTRDDFVKAIPTNAELKICRFGLLPLDYLENLNSTKQQSRHSLDLPENKIIITIGYNLNPNQQHLKIIEEIKKLRNKDYYDDLFLLVPLTYPADKHNYRSELLNTLESTGLAFKTFENYLPEIENAHLRNCSDIMLQLQTNDQLSGAMQEYLCTENLVISGSWLPYKILLDKGINMIMINSLSELSGVLDKTISNIDSLKTSVVKNRNVIMELSSWKKNIKNWIDIYN